MSYLKKTPLALFVSGSLLININSSIACGPDLPNRLLTDRSDALFMLPEGNFYLEVSQLFKPNPQLPQIHEQNPQPAEEQKSALTPEQSVIATMRQQTDANKAYSLGSALSPAARLYTTGAVAFKHDGKLAAEYFGKVLALPEKEQGQWGLMAHYSLGRLWTTDFNTIDPSTRIHSPAAEHLTEALQHYQAIIDRVKQGIADPDALSVSSLGQQARIQWWQGNYSQAAHLYLQQASQGDRSGYLSLQFVSSQISKDKDIRQKAIQDPLLQRLLTIELFTRSENLWFYAANREAIQAHLDTLLKELKQHTQDKLDYADKLAALAYRSGHYEFAANLLKQADNNSGLAWWIRAKMALRNGNTKAAIAAYARAAALFPTNEHWGRETTPSCRISAERSILALKRDDFLDAISLMLKAGAQYQQDIADIAERILTVDELKNFVDQHVLSAAQADANEAKVNWHVITSNDVMLKELLARRLMRVKRYQEALPYFTNEEQRTAAKNFIATLHKLENKEITPWQKAGFYYQAAFLLRKTGMEIVGYEMAPDFHIDSGSAFGRIDLFATDLMDERNKPWITKEQLTRAASSLPAADQRRFHYRWKAVDLALQSAELLPHKSQAYAAVLCNAASWVINKDPATGSKLYRLYAKNGTHFDWASRFGYECPQPDFSPSKDKTLIKTKQQI